MKVKATYVGADGQEASDVVLGLFDSLQRAVEACETHWAELSPEVSRTLTWLDGSGGWYAEWGSSQYELDKVE